MSATRDHRAIALTDLARDPALVDRLDLVAISAVLIEVAALQTRLGARLLQVHEDRATDPDDRLLDIREAAERLGVSTDWLRRRSTSRELSFQVRMGGVVRYSQRALAQWIARRTRA